MTLLKVIAVFYGIVVVATAVVMVIRDERKALKERNDEVST